MLYSFLYFCIENIVALSMLTLTKGVVLRCVKYNDTSSILDIFTECLGRVSFIVRLSSRSNSRMKKQLFQPLTQLEIEFDHRPSKSLQYIRNVRLIVPYTSIPFEPTKYSFLFFLAEFLYYVTNSEQNNTALYGYISNSLQWLDTTNNVCANFHLVFMMHIAKFIGFYPNLENYSFGSYFDLRSGEFSKSIPLHADYLNPFESSRIRLLMRMNYETMHIFSFNHIERNRIVELILFYYRLHISNMPSLTSFEILKDVFK